MFRTALVASILALTLLAGAPAHAVPSGTIGLAEGDPSAVTCPNKTYLAGFAAQYDIVLSGLMPYCVAMAQDGAWEGGAQIHMDLMMSEAVPGGRRLDFFCPRDFYMFGVRGFSHIYGIHSIMVITLTCLNVKTGARTAFGTQPNGASITEWPEVYCPDGTVANGVLGRINSARIIQFGYSCAKTQPAILMSQMLVGPDRIGKAKLMTPKQQGGLLVKPGDKVAAAAKVMTPKGSGMIIAKPSDSLSDVIAAPQTQGSTGSGLLTRDKASKIGSLITTTDTPQPDPQPVPAPKPASQAYEPPYTQSGARVYACQTIGGNVCGEPVASAFCQQQGFGRADAFNSANQKEPAETLAGQKCTKKKCKVFTQIVCVQ
jgi:hypothetical protein